MDQVPEKSGGCCVKALEAHVAMASARRWRLIGSS
jgi:hypothetical protein